MNVAADLAKIVRSLPDDRLLELVGPVLLSRAQEVLGATGKRLALKRPETLAGRDQRNKTIQRMYGPISPSQERERLEIEWLRSASQSEIARALSEAKRIDRVRASLASVERTAWLLRNHTSPPVSMLRVNGCGRKRRAVMRAVAQAGMRAQ